MLKKSIRVLSIVFVLAICFSLTTFAQVPTKRKPLNKIEIEISELLSVEGAEYGASTMEGGCYVDGCLYYYLRDGASTDNYGTLVSYDLETNEQYTAATAYLQHGNDMTYCDTMGYFVVAGCEYFDDNSQVQWSNVIYCITSYGTVINRIELTEFDKIIGIAFLSSKNQYIIFGRPSNSLKYVYKFFSLDFQELPGQIPYFASDDFYSNGAFDALVQGIDCDSNYIYASLASNDNYKGYISVTSLKMTDTGANGGMTGNSYVCTYSFNTPIWFFINSNEVENVSRKDNTFYIGCNTNHSDTDTVFEWSFVRGDANDDGTLDMLDVLQIRKKLVEETLTNEIINIDYLAADANYDGIVNDDDIVLIRKRIAGQPW